MRTRPHMSRSIIGAAFGFLITLTLVDPCAGQQNVTAPYGAAIGRDVTGSTIIIHNHNGPPSPSRSPSPDNSLANISGRWRDSLGTVYQVDQQGTQFSFTAEGNWMSPPNGSLCRGPFRSQGGGTVLGDIATSTYQTTAGSRGNCSTKISDSIMNCVDTICGKFSVSMSQQ